MIVRFKQLFFLPFRLFFTIVYKSKFQSFGWRSVIISPLRIDGGKRICIGNRVIVNYKSWLASTSETGYTDSSLILEDGCTIGNFNHIYATNKVVLHKNVLTADKVYISDNLHSYEDIHIPIVKQPIKQNGVVEIGEGSWIGENVCILGVRIGKHCVIGANSVVTNDIPDYCIAVGAPAKIIKRYDFNTCIWTRVNTNATDKTSSGGGKIYNYVFAA